MRNYQKLMSLLSLHRHSIRRAHHPSTHAGQHHPALYQRPRDQDSPPKLLQNPPLHTQESAKSSALLFKSSQKFSTQNQREESRPSGINPNTIENVQLATPEVNVLRSKVNCFSSCIPTQSGSNTTLNYDSELEEGEICEEEEGRKDDQDIGGFVREQVVGSTIRVERNMAQATGEVVEPAAELKEPPAVMTTRELRILRLEQTRANIIAKSEEKERMKRRRNGY